MSYNDYDDYGGEPRRAGRRATREPAGPTKVQGSTAAAILVLVAIVGFGIGAIMGNAGGDDPNTAAESEDGAPLDSPDDQSEADDGEEDGNEDEPDIVVTLEMDGSAPAGEELEYRVLTEPAQPGLVLGIERRQPGGDWGPFGDPQVQAETGEDGEDEGYVITGVVGEAEWRVVGEINGQRVESNVVTATITEGDDDNSGRGNGNGNGNGDDD